jgi:hypothetical protein
VTSRRYASLKRRLASLRLEAKKLGAQVVRQWDMRGRGR